MILTMIVGVVGKANVGKSTFFKAATLAEVEIANYPFATIKPNSGVGYVKIEDPAKPFGKISNPREGFVLNGKRFVPIQLIDVAGLVPGAHDGKGMGNQFLDDLRQADVLIHVVDIAGTTNEKGEPIEPGTYDPKNDILFLDEELDYWILGLLKKGWEKFSRTVQQTNDKIHKALSRHVVGLGVTEEIVLEILNKSDLINKKITEWTESDLMNLGSQIRRKTKPMIIACNKIDVPGAEENFIRIQKEFPGKLMVRCSAESELALREAAKHSLINYIPGEGSFELNDESKLNERQKKALNFIKSDILGKHGSTGVQNILDKAVFELLKYIALFPGGATKLEDQHGNVIPDCFLMPGGTTALQFAFRLHSDFGNNFIRAIDVKTKRTVGKDHMLKDGDIVEIVANR
ncbi:MAG TPA: redox-regulated ATPase YchF [Candidatus Nanoarchaeia archaeon]|nr:redox-regulated ATPase YchF [Candidatus Nanoarchaeia archaeon]